MTNWVCCNVCFHPPSAQIRLAITSCGHVFCSKCAYKGKQGKCLVCNEKCQISALSDKTPPDVKTLFFDIDHTTNEHLLEIVKVLRFQARHSKRLLTHYRERNEKLEEGWLKMKQENQQMANQLKEQHAYISELKHSLQSLKASSMGHGSQGAHGRNVRQFPFNSTPVLSRHSSSSNIHGNVVADEPPSFLQPRQSQSQPINVPGLSRIIPPHDGRMGLMPQRRSSQTTNYPVFSTTVSRSQRTPVTPNLSFGRPSTWNSPFCQPSQSFQLHPRP
ncbi:probable E3 SUMO-protein ligase RNF212 isoform X2 [Corythoichthys intestinalis]|uniref:probable E3 SUMO-protein ligase RNF212 isoform X2 n=1 Tax=Corythoichthys intestinalis TaxID=161448 RepID=UPI0025A5BA0A|nr:probable E3 SUMO-protein ligase RNF212 isoform X2 [Corythoichthys intestinalis]